MRHAMRYSHACNVEWKMIRRERADGFGTEEVITLATAIAIVSRICSHPRSPLHSLPPPGRRLLRPSAHLPWRGITHHAICTIPDSPTVAVLQEICFCYADETRYELLADEITTEVFPAAIYPHASVYTPAPPPTHLQAWNDPAGDAMRASMRATWAQRLLQKPGDMIIRGLKPLSAEEERQKALQQHVQLKQVPPTIPFLVHCPTRQTCTFASDVQPAHRRQARPRAARCGRQGRLDTAKQGSRNLCCQPVVSSCHHLVLDVAGCSREPRRTHETGSTRVQKVVSLALMAVMIMCAIMKDDNNSNA